MRLLLPFLASLTLAAIAPAQDCANLTVSQNNSEITFELTSDGDDNALAIIAIGKTEGNTSISFGPLGSLELGLAMPFAPIPIGFTSDGDASRSFTVPSGIPAMELFAQGLTAELTIGLDMGNIPPMPMIGWDFCTSNVVGFQLN